MTKLIIEISEHQYNNIKAFNSINLARWPYKGIIMYAINAIKRGRVLEQEPILEKIRAEIDKIYEREGNSVDCLNALNELKWFIDKYKGESEG